MARISLYDIWKYENPDVQETEIDFYEVEEVSEENK